MSALSELWFGCINPSEDKPITAHEKELLSKMAEIQESLFTSLDDNELQLFKKYIECSDKYASSAEVQAFEIGFKLATKIFTE